MDDTSRLFVELLQEKAIQLSEQQLIQFDTYYRELVHWNEKMNLTGITEREQVYVKHFYDSASLSFFMPIEEKASIIDIGSGAGFPSIPLKIIFPHLKVTIVDSLNKRIQFLNHLVTQLQLEGVTCIHSRAEDAARLPALRDQFDLATARAVARLNILNELCLPFVRVGGHFVAMKGSDTSEELRESANSLRELRAELITDHQFELPIEQASRHLVVIRKLGATAAKYPRKAGVPAKNPL